MEIAYDRTTQRLGDAPLELGANEELALRIYVTDKRRYLQQLKEVGSAYRALFGHHYPAMALVQVADLLEDGALVEIEALAALPANEPSR